MYAMDFQQQQKQRIAEEAVTRIASGMRIGLGSGSTAQLFVKALGRAFASGKVKDILCVPTSIATEALAQEVGLPLMTLPERLDITVDGADEVDLEGNLIKGMGGALLREKIVAFHSARYVILADETKFVEHLGHHTAIPLEVLPFGVEATLEFLSSLGQATLRMVGDQPFLTDQEHYIVHFTPRDTGSIETLSEQLSTIPGVLEHGLFLQMTHEVIGMRGEELFSLSYS